MEQEMPFSGTWEVREYSFRTTRGWESAYIYKPGQWTVKLMPDGSYISVDRAAKQRRAGVCSFDPQSGILTVDGIASYVPDGAGGRESYVYCFENKIFIPHRREIILEYYAESRYLAVKMK